MMTDKKIFIRGEVYKNPDEILMMVTDVTLMDCGLHRIDYITEEGEHGWFDTDEKAIINNIELYTQPNPTPPVSESEALKTFPNYDDTDYHWAKWLQKNEQAVRQALQLESVGYEECLDKILKMFGVNDAHPQSYALALSYIRETQGAQGSVDLNELKRDINQRQKTSGYIENIGYNRAIEDIKIHTGKVIK